MSSDAIAEKYRVHYGTAMNVYEIDEAGRVKLGLCFAPKGSLVTGDVMLAQKIALETFERRALAGANRCLIVDLQLRSITAIGRDTPQGFVVQAGSFSAKDRNAFAKDHFPYIIEFRADLLKSGVLVPDIDRYRFSQDYTFNSPSLAFCSGLGSFIERSYRLERRYWEGH
jgi:hypothetical protein